MSEINPNHPVTRAMALQWHKLAALIMCKLGVDKVEITAEDLQKFITERPAGTTIVCDTGTRYDSPITLRLVSEEEAQKIARKAGGLPT